MAVEKAPPATSTPWKASVSSTFLDYNTVNQGYEGFYYKFKEIQISMENLELNYQAPGNLTAIVRAQYLTKSFDLAVGPVEQAQKAQGLGDTFVGAAKELLPSSPVHLAVEAGIFLPTGSFNVNNPYAPGTHYDYRLQLGSGTYDGSLALTSFYATASYVVGAKLSSVFRAGTNSDGYRLGNQYRADAFADLPLKYGLTPRLVGYYRITDAVNGNDNTLNLATTQIYHFTQVDWMTAAALRYQHPLWQTVAVTAEAGLPLAQGMVNNDHLVCDLRFYGSLGLVGQF